MTASSCEEPDRTYAQRLAAAWPTVSARLHRDLRGRGTASAEAEDVVQEVALRALAREVPFTDPDDLLRWGYRVARNAAVDVHRRAARLTDDAALLDRPDGTDVQLQVQHRIALGAVTEALATLSAADRHSLLSAEPGPRSDRRTATRLAVRRHRARARLRQLTGPVLGISALGWLRSHRVAPIVLLPAAAVLPGLLVFGGGPAPADLDLRRVPEQRVLPAAAAVPSQQPASPDASTLRVTQPRPRTASARPTGRPAPARSAGARPPAKVVAVTAPLGNEVGVGTRDRQPDDSLVCVRDVGADVCADPLHGRPLVITDPAGQPVRAAR